MLTKPQVAMNTRLRARNWLRTEEEIVNAAGETAVLYKAEGNVIIVYPDGSFDRKDNSSTLRLRAGWRNASEEQREYQRKLRAPQINVEQVAHALINYINRDVR